MAQFNATPPELLQPPASPNAIRTTSTQSLHIYTDDSWNLHAAGWGCVFLHNEALLLYVVGYSEAASPLDSEITAITKALTLLQDPSHVSILQNFTSVCIFSDCLQLVNALKAPKDQRDLLINWPALHSFHKLTAMLEASSHYFTYSHISRTLNQDAHCLADVGRRCQEELVGFYFPTFKPP